jgi:dTDP-D-glucose 4,6-dehydratase
MKNINHLGSRFYWIACSATFVKKYPQYQIFNLDALTYGNLENIVDIEKAHYTFYKGDIVDAPFIDAFAEHHCFCI